MPTKQLEASIRFESDLAILDLHGEIDGFAESALDAAYSEAESKQPPTIVLNFSDVGYINSTGIALIVGLLARARKDHRQLIIFGLNEHYKEIFHITRLADFMSIFPDEQSAIHSIQSNK